MNVIMTNYTIHTHQSATQITKTTLTAKNYQVFFLPSLGGKKKRSVCEMITHRIRISHSLIPLGFAEPNHYFSKPSILP